MGLSTYGEAAVSDGRFRRAVESWPVGWAVPGPPSVSITLMTTARSEIAPYPAGTVGGR